jgi:hypothetical protein
MKTEKRIPTQKFTSLDDFAFDNGIPVAIGTGSFASVLLATSRVDGRRYAIKTVF